MHVWKTKKTRLACCRAVEKKEDQEEASLPPLSLLLTNQLQLYYVHQAISLQELAESIVVELWMATYSMLLLVFTPPQLS